MSNVHPAMRGWRWHCCKVPSDQDFFSVLDMNKGIRMASFRELTLSDKRSWGLVSHCLIKVQEAVNQGLLGTCVGDIILLEDKPVKSFSWWKVTFNCPFAFLLFLLFICPFDFVNVSYYKNITGQRCKPSRYSYVHNKWMTKHPEGWQCLQNTINCDLLNKRSKVTELISRNTHAQG